MLETRPAEMRRRFHQTANEYGEATLCLEECDYSMSRNDPLAGVPHNCATDDHKLTETRTIYVTGVNMATVIKAMYSVNNATVFPFSTKAAVLC